VWRGKGGPSTPAKDQGHVGGKLGGEETRIGKRFCVKNRGLGAGIRSAEQKRKNKGAA